MEQSPGEKVSFWVFIEQMKKNNFGHFMLYGSLMTFAIAMITPFISLYFLKDLGLANDYFFYTILISAATLTSIVSMPYWGKIMDRHGTIRLLAATGFLACFYPLLLIFIRDPILLIALQLFDGVAFSGFLLSLYNFIYDSFEPKKLIYYSAFQSILFGTATFCGTLIGGYLLMFPLPELIQTLSFGYIPLSSALSSVFIIPFFVICAASFVIRIVVYFALIWQIKDVRDTKYISERQLVLSVLTFQPVRESLHQSFSYMLAGASSTVAVVEDELERAERFTINKIRTAKKVTKKTINSAEKVIQKKRKDRGFI
jgi:MFS family permease